MFDAVAVMKDFGHRGEAVRRTGRIGDDLMGFRIVGFFVDAEHQGHIRVFRGGGDDHLLCARREMATRALPLGETPGGFDHILDPQVSPGEVLGVFLRQDLDRLAADQEVIFFGFDRHRKLAVHRIVLQQMGQRPGIGQIVDRHELQLGIAEGGPEDIAPDPAEAVYSDTYRHRGPTVKEN